jgi:HEXXH motif-containing protein
LITTHSLPADAFTALASGAGDSAVIRHLREAQLSKHLMLLHVVAGAGEASPPSTAAAAFQAGYQLLAELQAVDPGAVAWLVRLPHIGSWAHDCLACLDEGSPPDLGYLACAAAAAAVRLGVRFELDVPVRDGCVLLPGLGQLCLAGEREWIRLSSDGERLRAGEGIDVPCAALVPDDGSPRQVPLWRGTPLVRAVADGQTWEVLLETADKHLDRFTLPMLPAMTADEVTNWRHRIQGAWELLVRHHGWTAGPIADGVPVIVPLVPRGDLDSATSPAAFGAVATSASPSAVSMAETLVHEFQHIKLCGLMDMLPLIEPNDERSYAPWREDPRPLGGLLQGVYAFSGISRFWNVQRHVETEPDDILRANVLYDRWRSTIELATSTMLETGGFLTPAGTRFVRLLREQGRSQASEPVPDVAREIAREVALDNWLTWQLRHTALDAAVVASLADACKRGEPFGDQVLPDERIEDDTRQVDSIPRGRLLHMRYQDPQRYQRLSAAGLRDVGTADGLLIRGDWNAAVAAYRAEIAAQARPDAWIGLALAINRLPDSPSRQIFATRLPLLFEVHACLADQGIHRDPLEIAAWFE